MSTVPENSIMSDLAVRAFFAPRLEDAPPTVKRWNREEYYRLDEQGWFLNQRAELIDGEIVQVSPQSFGHYWSVDATVTILEEVFGDAYWVRSQGPCTFGEWSEPEPDVSVVRGTMNSYDDHPTTAVLIVEVSRSTLSFDRGTKASLYAGMGVPDYWVLDLENRQLIVHRQPTVDASARFGHKYSHFETLSAERSVSPLEKPEANLAVADMLPPQK